MTINLTEPFEQKSSSYSHIFNVEIGQNDQTTLSKQNYRQPASNNDQSKFLIDVVSIL